MENLFVLLTLISFFLLIIGIFSPQTSLFWYKKERTKKKSLLIYGITLLVFFFAFGAVTDNSKNAPAVANVSEQKESKNQTEIKKEPETKTVNEDADNMPIEQKIGIIDSIYDPSDIRITRIKTLLSELAETYNEPIDTIAENTNKAKEVLEGRGINESCLDILETMHRFPNQENLRYKEAIILFVLARDNNN